MSDPFTDLRLPKNQLDIIYSIGNNSLHNTSGLEEVQNRVIENVLGKLVMMTLRGKEFYANRSIEWSMNVEDILENLAEGIIERATEEGFLIDACEEDDKDCIIVIGEDD